MFVITQNESMGKGKQLFLYLKKKKGGDLGKAETFYIKLFFHRVCAHRCLNQMVTSILEILFYKL